MSSSDQKRIEDIYYNAVKLMRFVNEKSISLERILNDEEIQWFITTPLSIIGAFY